MVWEVVVNIYNNELPVNIDHSRYNYKIEATATGSSSGHNLGYRTQVGGETYLLFNGMSPGTETRNLTSSNIPNGTIYFVCSYDVRGVFYREAKNTAPTLPGAFTQPVGDLEIGDVRTISWGTSTDAQGNLIEYVSEYQINSGVWVSLTSTSSPMAILTIPNATSIKFRVKARDSQYAESGYQESTTFTITKPKYYWSKYNVAQKVYYESAGLANAVSANIPGNADVCSGITLNPDTGYYTGVGTRTLSSSKPPTVGEYIFQGDFVYRISKIGIWNGVVWGLSEWQNVTTTSSLINIRGALTQSGIIAIEGTYPTDGQHNDGSWYVRGARVNQSIAPPGIFTSPAAGTILKPSQVFNAVFNPSTAANISTYEIEYRYNTDAWVALAFNNTTTRSITTTTDKTKLKIQFRVRAKNTSNVYSDYIHSNEYSIVHNVAPTITVKKPDNSVIAANGIWALTTYNVSLDFKIQGNDPDTTDTLQYRVYHNNVERTTWTNMAKATDITYTIPAANVAIGSNALRVEVKDSAGAVTTFNFTATLSPQSPVDYSSLSNIRWGGYNSPTISLAELINLIN